MSHFKYIIALPILIGSLTVHAENDHKFFVGFNIGGGSGTHEGKAGSFKAEADLDTSSSNLHIGFMLKNNNRFLLSFDSLSMEDDLGYEFEGSGLRLDWQFVYGNEKVQPYFGLGFGFYSSDDLAQLYDETSLNGISFQIMGGLKILLNEVAEIDLNIQSQAISWQDIDYYGYGYSYLGSLEQTTSHVTFNVGLDFKF